MNFIKRYRERRAERRATAIHEAGHVAMFWFLNWTHLIERVNMVGTETRNAQVELVGGTVALKPTSTAQAERLAMGFVMIGLAGTCADNLAGTYAPDWANTIKTGAIDGQSDGDSVLAHISYLGTLGFDRESALSVLAEATEHALRDPRVWGIVEAVAAKLTRRGTIGRVDLMKVINRAARRELPEWANEFGFRVPDSHLIRRSYQEAI